MASRQLALDVLSDEAKLSFRRIIKTVEPGELVSVNSLRFLLDAADIPNPSRGGLFSTACAGSKPLLEPYRIDGFDVTTRSSGESAHGSSVRLYRRLP